MRPFVLAAITGAAALFIAPRPADACSCEFELNVTPADGATDVPTNVILIVTNRRAVADVGTDVIILEGPSGEVAVEVSSVVDQSAHRVELVRPLAPLEPLGDYTLRADLSEVSFRTGSQADVVTPEPVGLGELTLAHANVSDAVGFSCGDEYWYVDLAIAAPADAVAVDVFVNVDEVRSHYIVEAGLASWSLSSWNEGCGLLVPLQTSQPTCFEVRARDAAGNLGEPMERCATVTACADLQDPEAFDGDLGDCEPFVEPEPDPPGDSGGCRSTSGSSLAVPFAALVLLLHAVRRRRRRIALLAALALAAVVTTAARPAHACSCWSPLRTAPVDGAIDVPTDMVIVIVNRSPVVLYADLDEPVLTGPDGPLPIDVSLVFDAGERAELIRPRERLAASTEYSLAFADAEIAFRTGAGADDEAPTAPELGPLAIFRASAGDGGHSCGSEYLDIDLAIELPDDAVAADVRIEKNRLVELDHVIVAERIADPLGGADADCSRNFPFERGDHVCFEVRSRDQAGNRSEPVRRCTTVTACVDVADTINWDGDLTGCEPAPPESGGCRSTSTSPPLPLALLLLALYAVRRSARYARKCRIAARADSRSPARS